MSYLYHLVPQPLIGYTLHLLNVLKQHAPEACAIHIKKYQGREELLRRCIPFLNCLWNDVLHLSPVPPTIIRDALVQAGFEWHPRAWFRVDPVKIGFSEQNAAIYLYSPRAWGDFAISETDFKPFSCAALREFTQIPAASVEYYRIAKEQGERPFLFHRIPHILYRGSIALDRVQIINV